MSKKNLTSNIVLIDDDELIHLAWSREALKKSVTLNCFKTVDEFLLQQSSFDMDTLIYIDSHLSNEIRGEVESEKILQAGHKNIYLTTGYAKEDVDLTGIYWIKEIVSKKPQF